MAGRDVSKIQSLHYDDALLQERTAHRPHGLSEWLDGESVDPDQERCAAGEPPCSGEIEGDIVAAKGMISQDVFIRVGGLEQQSLRLRLRNDVAQVSSSEPTAPYDVGRCVDVCAGMSVQSEAGDGKGGSRLDLLTGTDGDGGITGPARHPLAKGDRKVVGWQLEIRPKTG